VKELAKAVRLLERVRAELLKKIGQLQAATQKGLPSNASAAKRR
jgi:hypothetical protein